MRVGDVKINLGKKKITFRRTGNSLEGRDDQAKSVTVTVALPQLITGGRWRDLAPV